MFRYKGPVNTQITKHVELPGQRPLLLLPSLTVPAKHAAPRRTRGEKERERARRAWSDLALLAARKKSAGYLWDPSDQHLYGD